MLRNNRELWLAALAALAITAGYLWLVAARPAALASSALAGHGLGILGFLLMLMTETLYSLRKRARSARWGRMSTWLQFHIFTGLVGPYMVLLHAAWKFNGLAGIVMLMTAIVVASGALGRYIYTAIPRTADGVEIEAEELARQIAAIEAELATAASAGPQSAPAAPRLAAAAQGGSAAPPWGAGQTAAGSGPAGTTRRLAALQSRRRVLDRQVASLVTARRALATWHSVHIPLGMAMFAAALIHTGAALYYATLLH